MKLKLTNTVVLIFTIIRQKIVDQSMKMWKQKIVDLNIKMSKQYNIDFEKHLNFNHVFILLSYINLFHPPRLFNNNGQT